MTFTPGLLGGIAAADTWCEAMGAEGGHSGKYVAWLSSLMSSAAVRVGLSATGWARIDGMPVAATVEQLEGVSSTDVPGQLWYPLRLDEHGSDWGSAAAFTATSGGSIMGSDCGDYTSTSTGTIVGGAADRAMHWSDSNTSGIPCNLPAHLYCFQVDGSAQTTGPLPPPNGAQLIWTQQNFQFSAGGLTAADNACGVNNVAWIASNGLTADGHLRMAAGNRLGPWYRPDGVIVVKPNAAWTGLLDAPIDVDRNGSALSATTLVWTGASSPDLMGSNASTCSDWTITTGSGLAAIPDASANPFGGTSTSSLDACTNSYSLYCLQP